MINVQDKYNIFTQLVGLLFFSHKTKITFLKLDVPLYIKMPKNVISIK